MLVCNFLLMKLSFLMVDISVNISWHATYFLQLNQEALFFKHSWAVSLIPGIEFKLSNTVTADFVQEMKWNGGGIRVGSKLDGW